MGADEVELEESDKKSIESPEDEDHHLVERGLKLLGKGRDVVLGVLGTAYVLGYLIWSYTAYRHQLGLLPLFKAQYLIAGLVPLTIAVVCWLVVRVLDEFHRFSLAATACD